MICCGSLDADRHYCRPGNMLTINISCVDVPRNIAQTLFRGPGRVVQKLELFGGPVIAADMLCVLAGCPNMVKHYSSKI